MESEKNDNFINISKERSMEGKCLLESLWIILRSCKLTLKVDLRKKKKKGVSSAGNCPKYSKKSESFSGPNDIHNIHYSFRNLQLTLCFEQRLSTLAQQ